MSSVYAFVDESVRPGRYLLCCVVIDPNRLGATRRALRHLVLPGQRTLHFKKESPQRRKELLVALGSLHVRATVYLCRTAMGRDQDAARAVCMAAVVEDLQSSGQPAQLYVERRDGLDEADRVVIRRVRRPEPALSFEHLEPDQDPLLWLPDCFAWPVGAGGDWRRRIDPIVDRVVDLS